MLRREQWTCRTTAPINGFINGGRGLYQCFHSSKSRREGTGNTTGTAGYAWHSPAICSREEVVGIHFFPNQSFFDRSIEMKGRVSDSVAVTQSSNAPGKTKKKTRSAKQISKQLYKGYKRIYQFTIIFFLSTIFAVFSTPYHLFSTCCQLFSTPPPKFSLPSPAQVWTAVDASFLSWLCPQWSLIA